MLENLALYSQTLEALPDGEMQVLAPGASLSTEQTEHGFRYIYRWPDLKIVCSVMPEAQRAEHLRGFVGYVKHISGGHVDERSARIIARILQTKLVVGVEIDPGRDKQGRAGTVLNKLTYGLRPIVFYRNSLLDWNGKLLLGPNRSFDPNAEIA